MAGRATSTEKGVCAQFDSVLACATGYNEQQPERMCASVPLQAYADAATQLVATPLAARSANTENVRSAIRISPLP